MNIERNCAFTGHRPALFKFKYDESHKDCINIKRRLYREIERVFFDEGVKVFISGGALGVDMWAMEAVLEFRKREPSVRLVAAIPFRGQEAKWSFAQKERYHNLIAQCDKAACFSEFYYSGCYHERDRKMVENAGKLIAVYDGRPDGGTAYTVEYARRLGRCITVIDPNNAEEIF